MVETIVGSIDTSLFYIMYEMATNQLVALGLIILSFLVFSIDITNTYTKKSNGVILVELIKYNKWPNRLLKSIWLIVLYFLFSQLWFVFAFIILSILLVIKNLKFFEKLKPTITQEEIDKI